MYLIYNSTVLTKSDFRVDADDRAFQYGDGLFETLRYERGQLQFWPDHYQRLTQGMTALHLDQSDLFSAASLHEQIKTLLAKNHLIDQTARVRMQVWRQPGGLYTPTSRAANLLITTRSAQPFSITGRDRIGLFDAVRLSPSPVSAFKTGNALPYVLAGLAKHERELDDVVLLDTAGHVAECVASSLFWLADDTLFMPSLETGCIDGILRCQIIRLAAEGGVPLREGLFRPDVLARADAVFCGNVMGIQWFRSIEGIAGNRHFSVEIITQPPLATLFDRLLQA